MHAGIFMGLRSQGVGCMEVSLGKTGCRCTSTHLHCALLSKVLPIGKISLNAGLANPLLLGSQERIKKKALSLLWSIWIQVPAKSQTPCGNPHMRQGKDYSLSVKLLYLPAQCCKRRHKVGNINIKINDLILRGQYSLPVHHHPCNDRGRERVLAHRHF